mgnify:CR=1 FL=1
MNNFNKIQPIEGFYFSNYLIDNKRDNGETENGEFTISIVDKPDTCAAVVWGPKCLVPIRKPFRIIHPAFRGNYFKVDFKFFPPTQRTLPLFYVMLEKLLGVKV